MEMYLAMLSGGTQNTYYTKGEMLTVGGELYLIAYHQPVSINNAALMRYASNMPTQPKMTPETMLSLCLLNLHSLGSLSDF